MDSSQRLQELFDRYLRRETTSQEVQELVILLGQADAAAALSEPMYKLWEELKGQSVEYPVDWDKMYRQISQVEADLSTLQRKREGAPDRPTGFRIGWSGGRRMAEASSTERRGSEKGDSGEGDFDEPRRIDRLKHRGMVAAFLLLAGTAAYFSIRMSGGAGYSSRAVNIKPVMAWKPEEGVFDDITMGEAARRIGQRFNVTVSFASPVVKECRVTATFYQEDDLDQIMTVICGMSQSNFVIKGNTIVIDGKGCN